jgi:hypothetical protein
LESSEFFVGAVSAVVGEVLEDSESFSCFRLWEALEVMRFFSLFVVEEASGSFSGVEKSEAVGFALILGMSIRLEVILPDFRGMKGGLVREMGCGVFSGERGVDGALSKERK